jgi:hypothetical protein
MEFFFSNNFMVARESVCRIDSLEKLSPPFVYSSTLYIFYHNPLLHIFLLYLRLKTVSGACMVVVI